MCTCLERSGGKIILLEWRFEVWGLCKWVLGIYQTHKSGHNLGCRTSSTTHDKRLSSWRKLLRADTILSVISTLCFVQSFEYFPPELPDFLFKYIY